MSEDRILAQCSPTLAGLKTGSLFTYPYSDRCTLKDGIRDLNARIVPRGIRLVPLKWMEKRVLLYMYRPEQLRADLAATAARELLTAKRYPVADAERCVAELARRLQTQAEFPHEIGLFLGYPPEDVQGFLKLGAGRAKCVGTWRVYGDEAAARETFARYRQCTRLYQKAYRRHRSFDRLIVSSS